MIAPTSSTLSLEAPWCLESSVHRPAKGIYNVYLDAKERIFFIVGQSLPQRISSAKHKPAFSGQPATSLWHDFCQPMRALPSLSERHTLRFVCKRIKNKSTYSAINGGFLPRKTPNI